MTSDQELQFDPNSARFTEVLSRLKIATVKIEGWVVLQRSRFDITMDDEPFIALQLYLNTQTGIYLTRVWGRTHSKGKIANSMTEIELLCNQIFAQGMTCCPGTSGNGVVDTFVSVDYPFKRMVSNNCIFFHRSNAPAGAHVPIAVCSECTSGMKATTKIKEENFDPSDFYPEVQVKEDAGENIDDIIADVSKVESALSFPSIPQETLAEVNANYFAWLESEKVEAPIHNEEAKTKDRKKGSYACPKCSFTTISKNSLINHIKTVHYGLKPYKCDECPYAAGLKHALDSHKKRKHGGAKEKKCPNCEYSAHSAWELKNHINRIHGKDNGRKPQEQYNSDKTKIEDRDKSSHACTMCGFTTMSNHSLMNHILEHNGLQPYKCDECPYENALKHALDLHKKREHPNSVSDKIERPEIPKPYRLVSGRKQQMPPSWKHGTASMECEHCGKCLVRKPRTISCHYRRHHLWGNFYCSLCEFFAYYPMEYASHMSEKHSDMEGGVAAVCCECGEQVHLNGNVDTLAVHYKHCAVVWENLRRKVSNKMYQSKVQIKEQNGELQKTPSVCHICGKEVNSMRQGAMRQHLRNHKLTMSLHCSYSACGILFPTVEEKRQHEKSVHKAKVHCDKCGKVFIGRGRLNLHVKVVHDRKSLDLKCTQSPCDKVFTNRSLRTWHINTIHFPNKYRCEICQKTLGSSHALQKHGLVHTDERNFQCQDCDRKFRMNKDLIDHKRSHTGEKPYACQHCPYRGATSSLLYHHKKQKHNAEFEEEKKQKEEAKIKISNDMLSGNNEGVGQN